MMTINQPNGKKCIFVLGMHRSGTSALAGVLQLLGADLGVNLIPPADENKKGFFENARINALNERILAGLDSSWDSLLPMPTDGRQQDSVAPLIEELKAVIREEFGGPLIAVKDPRICRMLPLWKTIMRDLNYDLCCLIPLRNPAEVARSLFKRDGFSLEKGTLLWTTHTFEAELGSRDCPRVFLSFNQLLANPYETIRHFAQTANLEFPNRLDDVISDIEEFLEPSLKHHSSHLGDTDDKIPSHILQWYRLLTTFTDERPIEAGDLERIDALREEFTRSYRFFYNEDFILRERQVRKKEEELIGREQTIRDLMGENDGLLDGNDHVVQAQGRDTILSQIETQVQVQDSVLAQKVMENAGLNQLLVYKEQEIQDRDQLLAEKDMELRAKEAVLADRDAVIAAQESMIGGFLNSRSWVVTKPFRAVMGLFRGMIHFVYRKIRPCFGVVLKGAYHRLPLPASVKAKLKQVFFRLFSRVLQGTETYQNYQYAQNHPCFRPETLAMEDRITEPEAIMSSIRQEGLCYKTPVKPRVSIIIPVYNNFQYTYHCLKSLIKHAGSIDAEIIVMDDFSSDFTEELLSRVEGIRTLRNDENMGFINSCNRAAEAAVGEFLVFLNNDTIVMPQWLDWLLWTFENIPDAGLVGAKFVWPNGQLLEAGSVIWKDGSASNYGRTGDPNRPEFCYLREVDYCSGAGIMIPRDLFFSVGLFDPNFCPAYYEDVDLAFKVKAAGRKVLYQPNSVIVHFEGITSGTDVSSGIKSYQVTNQEKFRSKWEHVIAGHADRGMAIGDEKERNVKKRILIMDICLCMRDQDAGSLRMDNLLDILQALGFKVTFYPDNGYYPLNYLQNLQGRGIEVLTPGFAESMEKYLSDAGDRFDVILLSRANVAAKYIDMVRKYCGRAQIIYDTVDLHFLREMREAELKNSVELFKAAEKRKTQELGIALKADVTLVVSHEEKTLIEREHLPIDVEVLSTIQEIYGCKTPYRERRDILFIGGFRHQPNVDAVVFFVNHVMPLVRKKTNDLKLYVIGSHPPLEILALAGEDVIVTGYIPDVTPYFERCRLSIAPLRWGAGIKGKINYSMSCGVPVVATPIAVEGMFLTHEWDVLIAEHAEDFAENVIRLYHDEELWNRLSVNGIENIRNYFSVEVAKRAMEHVLNKKK